MEILCFNGIHSLINNNNASKVCTVFTEDTHNYKITEIWNKDIKDEIDFKKHFLYHIISGLFNLREADLHAHIALSVSDENAMILCYENCYIEIYNGESCIWTSGRRPKEEFSILKTTRKYTKENRPKLPDSQNNSEFWTNLFTTKISEAMKNHTGDELLRKPFPRFTPFC